MKTKNIFILWVLIFFSCEKGINSKEALAEKRIKQRIETASYGMIKDFEIDSIKKINDTTFFARHEFFNPIIDKQIRISRKYILDKNLDSVARYEEVKNEMLSEGDWVSF